MKMLLIVFRESIVTHIHSLLAEHNVTAYTEVHNVAGKGETGLAAKAFLSPGANCMILTALPEAAAYRLAEAFSQFKAKHEHGHSLPLHVFSLPCEQII
ncbi:MAG: hypothetical protein U0412_05780 [Nitrospira sp.]